MDNCPTCGTWTEEGKRKNAEAYLSSPIFRTDLTKKKSEVVALARQKILEARNILDDFAFAYPGWKERVDHVNGLATCGLGALYATIQELEQYEKQWENR